MNTQLLQQARVLDIDEQIELVEAIWDGIVMGWPIGTCCWGCGTGLE